MPITTKSGKKYTSVVRAFPSLKDLDLQFEPYTEAELEVAAGGARRQWKSVWGLWDGEHWSEHPFSLDHGRPYRDPSQAGPSDPSLYPPVPSPVRRSASPPIDLTGDDDDDTIDLTQVD
jgi:hypothetical protein